MKIQPWNTPFQTWDRICLDEIHYGDELVLSISSSHGAYTLRWSGQIVSCRVFSESYCNKWFKEIGDIGHKKSFVVIDSEFQREIIDDPVLSEIGLERKLKYYVIVAMDEIVEILSFDPPEIEGVA